MKALHSSRDETQRFLATAAHRAASEVDGKSQQRRCATARILVMRVAAWLLLAVLGAPAVAGLYPTTGTQTFTYADSTTNLGDGTVLSSTFLGTFARAYQNTLQLSNKSFSPNSTAWRLADLDPGSRIQSFDVSFALKMTRSTAFPPGGGWTLNFGAIPSSGYGNGELGFAMPRGLVISFDTYKTAPNDDPSIDVYADNRIVATFPASGLVETTNITGGTFTLTNPATGGTTAVITYNANPSSLQTAMRAVGGWENVTVTGMPGNWVVDHNVVGNYPDPTGNGSNLVNPLTMAPGLGAVVVTNTQDGTATQNEVWTVALRGRGFMHDSNPRTVATHWDHNGLDLTYNGQVIFTNLPTPGFIQAAGNRFAFTASTVGIVAQDTFLDDLVVSTEPLPPQIPTALKSAIAAPPNPQGEEYFGSSVAMDGNYVVVGVSSDSDDTGIAKVFNASTGALLHVLPHPKPNDGDEFGAAVAISGTLVVVGAPRDDNDEAGRVFVFDLSRANPSVPVFTIKNPSPGEDEDFGASVAISGSRLVVGTPSDTAGFYGDAGSAYVFDLAGTTPEVPVTVLNNPAPIPNNNQFFGSSVAISGTRVAIGSHRGKAYVYNLTGPAPATPAMTLSAVGSYTYGASVAIADTTLVIGDVLANGSVAESGAAFVYNVGGALPALIATLRSPTQGSGERFGNSVAISSGLVVVGSMQEMDGAIRPGMAYIYNLSNPTVPMTIKNPTPAEGDGFGYAVAISAPHIVIGAPYDDTDAENSGSAYLYTLASGTPTVPISTLHIPGSPHGMQFGSAVAISGTRAVIGAPTEDAPRIDSGRVYIYDLASALPTVPVTTIPNPNPDIGDQFGSVVAIAGNRVAVGAPYDMVGPTKVRKVHIFDLNGSNPTVPVATLFDTTPDGNNDQFGSAIAIFGSIVVVGDSAHVSSPGSSAGIVYVYDLAAAYPSVPILPLYNPDSTTVARFGRAVAISGRSIVIGADANALALNGQVAYVYDLGSGTPAVPVLRLRSPPVTYSINFGTSVAISGSRVLVSAVSNDSFGGIYVYDIAGALPEEPVFVIKNPTPAPSSSFGGSLSISGSRFITGTYNTAVSGTTFIFDLASATPTVPVAIHDTPNKAGNERFGASVAIDGESAIVGAPWGDSLRKGLAYVYGPSDPGGPGTGGPVDEDGDGLLDSWERLFFGTTVGHSALDDADGDGLCELLELAFDRHPLWPETVSAPETVIYEDYLTTVILKRPGVTYLAQTADTLDEAAFSAATTTVLLDSETTLVVRDNVPVSTPGSRFMRVKVTAAP